MRYLAIVILLAAGGAAHAQASPRTGGPAPGVFKGTSAAIDLSVAGSLARGLVDRDLVSGRGGLNYWNGPWGVFVQPYYLYGDVKLGPMPRIQTDDERYLRVIVYRTWNDPLFAFAVGAGDHSLRRKIDRRGLGGGGFGATIVNRPSLMFVSSLGLLGELARYDGGSERRTVRTALRLYGRYRIANHLAIAHDVYLAPNVRDLGDLRAMGTGYLEVPIAHGFAGRIQIDATYEEVIVAGTQHSDIAITFGAAYKNDWKL